MSRFLQIHSLTFHGPSNINRDDTGRPKTAMIGGVERLRISSQAIKRAIRTSEAFGAEMDGHLSKRTQRLGDDILAALKADGVAEDKALAAAREVAAVFGKLAVDKLDGDKPKAAKGKAKAAASGEDVEEAASDDKKRTWIAQLAFVSPTERDRALDLARRIAAGQSIDPKKETPLLRADTAVDIAMFGRMLADDADFNRYAAVQVAHAITTHAAQAEEDWYSAVDDLNKAEDTGAGHLGETAFGSGIYYQYVCVNCDLLVENLNGDRELAARGVEALAKALPQTAPAGKQNSFAHRPMAFYMRAEAGPRAPRDLSGAFFTPVDRKLAELKVNDLQRGSIKALELTAGQIDACYHDGQTEKTCPPLNTLDGTGTLAEIVRFAGQAVRGA